MLNMDEVEGCMSNLQVLPNNINKIKTKWSSHPNVVTNLNPSTLLYIAVEYVKDEFKDEGHEVLSPEHFNNFEQHISTLDPNMSSVARYSPIYNEQNNFNSVVINQLDSSNLNDNLNTNTSLDSLPTVLCNSDINNVNNQYLPMVENDVISTDNSAAYGTIANAVLSDKDSEVEILITDQNTGITYYSVSTQELLVEEQQLLQALSPNPLLDSELLTIDESTLKNNLPEDLIDTSSMISAESNIVTSFISNFSDGPKNKCLENECKKSRNKNLHKTSELSPVYSITDKPIPTRARATLPENYLKILRIDQEWAVFAKKCIRKRTQFGPVQGILKDKQEVILHSEKLELLIQDGGNILSLDISDENKSNWMCFIRKAETYEEQNLVVNQDEKNLFFTVIKNILPKEELKVGYSYNYANEHNLPVLKKDQLDEQWPCLECTEQFSTSQDLQDHLILHEENKKYKIKFHRRIRKTKKKFLKISTMEACQCRICQQVFNPPKYGILKNHLSSKHNLNDKNIEDHFFIVRNYKCEKCNVVFNSENLIKIHNLQHNQEINDGNSDGTPYHICPSCNRKFPMQRQLILHVMSHSLPKYKLIPERFHCPICYTSYPLRERLQRHLLVHGPEESKPLQCSHCKKRFMNNSALTCHLKTHIIGENVYECPICKDCFDNVPKLKIHVQKHCINNTYTCPQCNKKFKAYSIIRKHIRAFHSERKYTCQHCSKIFPTIFKLKMHLLKHSDHREFLCADCGKQFKRRDKLSEHCKRVHSEERENDVPKVKTVGKCETNKLVTKVEPTDFHRFIYKCHPCVIGFKRRGMLVNHLAKRHPDISLDSVPELNLPILKATKDYYCQYCDKVYKSSSKRKAHILKNHPGAALPISNRQQGAYSEISGLPNPSFSQTVGSVTTSPQNCSWCHKQYASKAKLLQHQRKEHITYLEQTLDDFNIIGNDKSSDSFRQKRNIEFSSSTSNEFNMVEQDKGVGVNSMEEFVDDPEPQNEYCHLVKPDNDVFPQNENLNSPTSHLYRLLTNTSSLVPPR